LNHVRPAFEAALSQDLNDQPSGAGIGRYRFSCFKLLTLSLSVGAVKMFSPVLRDVRFGDERPPVRKRPILRRLRRDGSFAPQYWSFST
jgi:hypothetical protein